ncbi:VPLPA-CTERM sorting domain-containing protein [Paracoccus sp. 1_MG-2023]|uniref:alpha/beta hydrolase family protein n=1 Tax=unclassified Paracoccus (in: a-proteobacteria) TaxID=2688777 RepID=UPI001C08ED49|nr:MULTISPECIES: VPLPA-CTERM sorting domain-containing protein [unclassified Paracoccus (in: a-proteobacteria)]MBU2957913.1 VPLPA-CTERM sorting domain-containing protein [Paracoccus sp. C2R09]MDO6668894.1 VPLPA-CTERM sorting domain-containing protein [Paracoccus sp. 1_MG-2023]
MKHLSLTTAMFAMLAATPLAAQNRIDGQSPDAPELAAYGEYTVGVRQFDVVNPNQIDIKAIDAASPSAPLPTYDRPLTFEMWYPAATDSIGASSFNTYLRDGITEITLEGRAIRDATPPAASPSFPLVILSHGYPGNRFLMSHLAENLASKGYVVASIDHTDSTYNDQGAFASTLVNRSLDQKFVLNEIAKINGDSSQDLAGMIDTDNTALIGYSMGGYGTVVTAGGGLSEGALGFAPGGALDIHAEGSETHDALPDPRIKTAVAIGPWGMNYNLWDAAGLAGIEIPMLFMAGSDDTVSGYENGVRKIWEGATSVDRALLTFDGGGHNTVAPIPAPEESYAAGVSNHYTDDVWDTVFMNNVGQHFITAWLNKELKGESVMDKYLELTANGSDGIWSVDDAGNFTGDHTYWAGFAEGTANGIRYETLSAQPAPVPLPAAAWMLVLAIGGLGVMGKRRNA